MVVIFLPNGIIGGLSKFTAAVEKIVSTPAQPGKDAIAGRRSLWQPAACPRASARWWSPRDIEIDLPVGARYALIGARTAPDAR